MKSEILNTQKPFFSIILPVYNVEKFIIKCIDSILSQTYKNYEIIIVDDGSKDQTLQIINENYFDQRIKIFTKENGGLSDARNYGLNKASGKYVWFVDSDDYIPKINALELIYDKIKQSQSDNIDLIAFNMEIKFEGDKREDYVLNNVIKLVSTIDTFQYIENYNCFPFNVPTQCYRRDFLLDNKFKFKKGIFFEDIYLNLDIYAYKAKMIGINEALYTYFRRSNSITNSTITFNHFYSQILVLSKLSDFIKYKKLPIKFLKERINIDYERCKTFYKKELITNNYKIPTRIYIPMIKSDTLGQKVEKSLFYYIPKLVLNNQILFRKLSTLEKMIKKIFNGNI